MLGNGEVGKAIALFYDKPYIRDLSQDTFDAALALGGFDVLHVCIPFSKDFIDQVAQTIIDYVPHGITIIHSTVPVGTTEAVAEIVKQQRSLSGIHIVHSPVRGVHPNLHEGIKTFIKYIGADSAAAGVAAAGHLGELGIATSVLYHSRASELLKLLDTTYYGVCIAFHKYAAELCEQEGVNFDMVMRHANQSYNEGYTELGKENVVRPVLSHVPGPIGGHCVLPNADILRQQFGEDPLLTAILRHK